MQLVQPPTHGRSPTTIKTRFKTQNSRAPLPANIFLVFFIDWQKDEVAALSERHVSIHATLTGLAAAATSRLDFLRTLH
ncbi:hypothetical protein E2C01_059482 [Portunus trituberculatus]|uniref:Uncharacterized protein n=1 Tax=Portunus trituberculatus TaxID=210409 RepID=A0A5B7H8H5_PORTR|nr:hypothetical protein [Portunus trituberculatus]